MPLGRLVTRLWGRHGDSRYDKQLPSRHYLHPDAIIYQVYPEHCSVSNHVQTYERYGVAGDTMSGR
jgi:hypothetical protein